MIHLSKPLATALGFLLGGVLLPPPVLAEKESANQLILVTLDGVRCEELFEGMDLSLIKQFANQRDLESIAVYRRFWAPTPRERRERLMPFFWKELMVHHGSVIGNAKRGSVMHLKNRWRISYPGYSEILTGIVEDERIQNNQPRYNPNPSVLERLLDQRGLGFQQVAVFASWDVMRFVVQQEANTLFTNTGFQAYETNDPRMAMLSRLQFETRTPWDSVRSDAYTIRFALHHLERYRPEVFYVALGETDDWAHEKRYDRVLEALHQADAYLARLWKWLSEEPDYAGQTTLFITTDHGRGRTPYTWQNHNNRLPGARSTWLAVVSPKVGQRGEWSHHRRVYSSEIAATFAGLGGYDLVDERPRSAGPIEFLIEPP